MPSRKFSSWRKLAPKRDAVTSRTPERIGGLIGWWPMGELSGTVSADFSREYNNGAYTGVTLGEAGIGDGRTCPLFDGANDYNNVYSEALNTDFNNAEITLAVWLKVSGAGVWTDGTNRYAVRIAADANNEIGIFRSSANNRIDLFYGAGGTIDRVNVTDLSSTGWLHFAVTVSVSANELKGYQDGAQVGTTQGTLGTWSGALSSTRCVIGAAITTPTLVWDGTLAHALLYNRVLPAADIAKLALVGSY